MISLRYFNIVNILNDNFLRAERFSYFQYLVQHQYDTNDQNSKNSQYYFILNYQNLYNITEIINSRNFNILNILNDHFCKSERSSYFQYLIRNQYLENAFHRNFIQILKFLCLKTYHSSVANCKTLKSSLYLHTWILDCCSQYTFRWK